MSVDKRNQIFQWVSEDGILPDEFKNEKGEYDKSKFFTNLDKEDWRKTLYTVLSENPNYDVGTYEHFDEQMTDENKLRYSVGDKKFRTREEAQAYADQNKANYEAKKKVEQGGVEKQYAFDLNGGADVGVNMDGGGDIKASETKPYVVNPFSQYANMSEVGEGVKRVLDNGGLNVQGSNSVENAANNARRELNNPYKKYETLSSDIYAINAELNSLNANDPTAQKTKEEIKRIGELNDQLKSLKEQREKLNDEYNIKPIDDINKPDVRAEVEARRESQREELKRQMELQKETDRALNGDEYVAKKEASGGYNVKFAPTMSEILSDYQSQLENVNKQLSEEIKSQNNSFVNKNALSTPQVVYGDVSPLATRKRMLEQAIQAINDGTYTRDSGDGLGGFAADAALGMGRGLFKRDNLAFGLFSMVDATNQFIAAERYKEGRATDEDVALLNASAENAFAQQYLDENAGYGYSTGKITGEMVPFMLEMAINPLATTEGKLFEKGVIGNASKKTADFIAENAAKLLGKTSGSAIGKGIAGAGELLARGSGMALTTGLGYTIGDYMDRRTGDVKYDFTDNGVEFDGIEGGEGIIPSIYKAVLSQAFERTTEMSGALGAKAFGKILAKTPLGKIGEYFKKVPLTGWKGYVKGLQKAVNWDGPVMEYFEEVENNLLNAMFVGDMNFGAGDNGIFNPEDNLKTLLGVALTGHMFQLAQVGEGSYAYAKYNKARKTLGEDLSAQLDAATKDSYLDNLPREIIKFANDNKLTKEQRNNAYRYVAYKLKVEFDEAHKSASNVAKGAEAVREVSEGNAQQEKVTTTAVGGKKVETKELNPVNRIGVSYNQSAAALDGIDGGDFIKQRIEEHVQGGITRTELDQILNSLSPDEAKIANDYLAACQNLQGSMAEINRKAEENKLRLQAYVIDKLNTEANPVTELPEKWFTANIGGSNVCLINYNPESERVYYKGSDGAVHEAQRSDVGEITEHNADEIAAVVEENKRMLIERTEFSIQYPHVPVNNRFIHAGGNYNTVILPGANVGSDEYSSTTIMTNDGQLVCTGYDGNVFTFKKVENGEAVGEDIAMTKEQAYQAMEDYYAGAYEETHKEEGASDVSSETGQEGAQVPVVEGVEGMGAEGAAAPAVEGEGGVEGVQPVVVEESNNELPQGEEPVEEGGVVPMPMDENGKPAYAEAGAERSAVYIYNESGLEEGDADGLVEKKIDEAKKALAKVEKEKPKSMDIDDIKAERADINARKAAAERELVLWEGIKEARKAQIEAERMAQIEASNAAAIEAARVRAEEDAARKEAEAKALAEQGINAPSKELVERYNKGKKVEGNEDEFTLPNGEKIKGRYMIVESGTVTPSHNANNGFVKSEGYPINETGQTINDRDYEKDKTAQEHTRSIARSYDDRAINNPVVVSEGVVLSGNGRTMAGEIAAAEGTDGKYIQYLKDHAAKFGVTSEDIEGFKHPRIIFAVDEAMPYTTETMAKFNAEEKKGMNVTEKGIKNGKILDMNAFNRLLSLLNGYEDMNSFYNVDSNVAEILKEFTASGLIMKEDIPTLMDGGKLTDAGKKLFEMTFLGKALENDPDALRMTTEVPSMRQSLIMALGSISNNLDLGYEYTLMPNIIQAIRLVYDARKSGAYNAGDIVSEFARQLNAFETIEYDANSLYIADAINNAKTSTLRTLLNKYNEIATEIAQGQQMMFDAPQTRDEIFKEVTESLNLKQYGTKEKGQANEPSGTAENANNDRSVQEDGGRGEGKESGNQPQSSGANGLLESASAAIRGYLESSGRKLTDRAGRRPQEETDAITQSAVEWAKRNGRLIPIEDLRKNNVASVSGTEHSLFVSPDGKRFLKMNNLAGETSSDILMALERMIMHNELFPQTAYEFEGLVLVDELSGFVLPLFSQNIVQHGQVSNEKQIEDYMKSIGFTKNGEGSYTDGKIVVSDLFPRNVLVDGEGNIYPIDADFKMIDGESAEVSAETEQVVKQPNTAATVDDIVMGEKGKKGEKENGKKEKVDEKGAAGKIEDVGEKIGGARKDATINYAKKINLNEKTPAKIFPKPNFASMEKAGVPRDTLVLLKTYYTAFSIINSNKRKKRNGQNILAAKFYGAIAKDMLLRDVDVMNETQEGINLTEYGKENLNYLTQCVKALAESGREDFFDLDLSDIDVVPGLFKEHENGWYVAKDGKKYVNTSEEGADKFISIRDKIFLPEDVEGFTSEYIKKIEEAHDKSVQDEVRIIVYRKYGGGCYIAAKVKGVADEIVLKEGFESSKEAFAYRESHADELRTEAKTKADEMKNSRAGGSRGVSNDDIERALRDIVTEERIGKDYRNGKDVVAEDFKNTFGFRGVEFGNWATQGERQKHLNDCYDALMDLADLIGVTPKALSLGGKLAFAFGSRGRSGALAHYEPAKNVINLTKKRGAGCVAHEWFHALDNYLGGGAFSIEGIYATDGSNQNMRDELSKMFTELHNILRNSDMNDRSKSLDGSKNAYWSKTIEMAARAFESYVNTKLMERGQRNQYLSAHVPGKNAKIEELSKFDPYPSADEMKEFSGVFDRLFDTLQEKTDEEGNHVLYKKGDSIVEISSVPLNADGIVKLADEMKERYNVEVTEVFKGNETREELLERGYNNMEILTILHANSQNSNPDGERIYGFYSPYSGKVCIFADVISDASSEEVSIFHENIHQLVKSEEAKAVENEFFNSGANEYFARSYESSKAYNKDQQAEEFFVDALATAMTDGDVDVFKSYLGEEGNKLVDNILKSLRYDNEREMSARKGSAIETRYESLRGSRAVGRTEEGTRRTISELGEGDVRTGERAEGYENSGKILTTDNNRPSEGGDGGISGEGRIKFKKVTDNKLLDELESGKKVKAYRAMQLIDGELYPPMAAKQEGKLVNPIELGVWEQSEEHPELAVEKNGNWYFGLDKANGSKPIPARYNPYIHTSMQMLNDQFTSAWSRPNMVVTEVEVPESELTSGYKADKAKDAVGKVDWKSGSVSGKLAEKGKPRQVILTRYDKPVRVVPTEEVAKSIASQLEGTDIKIPFNTVNPELRDALVNEGVKIGEPEKGNAGAASREAYEEWKSDGKFYRGINEFEDGQVLKVKEDELGGEYSVEGLGGRYSSRERLLEQFRRKYGDYIARLNEDGDIVIERLDKEPQQPKSKKQTVQDIVFAEREVKRMVDAVEKMAEKLGVKVNVVKTKDGLEGKDKEAKGWYDPSTGEITIIVPNNRNVDDVMRTLLHEAVAHHGLRELFGANFDTFLDNVFNNLPVEIRNQIMRNAITKYGLNRRKATEEYLASIAEDMDFERAGMQSWWGKVKMFFLEMLEKAGLKIRGGLSDADIRSILWRSYDNLKNRGEGRVKYAPGFRTYGSEGLAYTYDDALVFPKASVADEETRLYRDSDASNDPTSSTYMYEKLMDKKMYVFTAAFGNGLQALDNIQKALEKATGEPIRGFENVVYRANALPSVDGVDVEKFKKNYLENLVEAAKMLFGKKKILGLIPVSKINDAEREELKRYMFAKHGLERNDVFAMRDAMKEARENEGYDKKVEDLNAMLNDGSLTQEEYDSQIDSLDNKVAAEAENFVGKYRKTDYSGLTALFDIDQEEEDAVAKAEAMAKMYVDSFEGAREGAAIGNFWNWMNATTHSILDKQYECGMITEEQYNRARTMFNYYVPLRGFAEDTAEDVYNYINSSSNASYQAPIKKANKRSSEADDPFAYIVSMAMSGILSGNRNLRVKQAFYNLALSHKTPLLSTGKVYARINELTGEYETMSPDIPLNATAEQASKIVDEFEKKMEKLVSEKPEEYVCVTDNLKIPYRLLSKTDKEQHQVIVKRGGKPYVVYVNGNPAAAQAINGAFGKSLDIPILKDIIMFMSKAMTTRNPKFIPRNFIRDALSSRAITFIKEGESYNLAFRKNWWICAGALMKVMPKYHFNTIEEQKKYQGYYKQFVENGGETGYAFLKDMESTKKEINKMFGKMSFGSYVVLPFKKFIDLMDKVFSPVNAWAETVSRFAAFVTSMERGRGVDQSIRDAKEVSVNFNTKGAGSGILGSNSTRTDKTIAYASEILRALYLFVNPSIQGMRLFGNAIKEHPVRGSIWIAEMTALGFFMPLINGWLQSLYDGGDGDDKNKDEEEDDKYNKLPDYVKRNNINVYASSDVFASIPLSQENRVPFGIGELMYSQFVNKEYTDEEFRYKLLCQITQMMPVDINEGGAGYGGLVPTFFKPLLEAGDNKSWNGYPIWKGYYGNNDTSDKNPMWTRDYEYNRDYLTDISKSANEISGGNDYKKGDLDWNPAKVRYVMNGYLGGLTKYPISVGKLVSMIWNEDARTMRNMPLLSGLTSTVDNNEEKKAINKEYHEVVGEAERYLKTIKDYFEASNDSTRSEKEREMYKALYDIAMQDTLELRKNTIVHDMKYDISQMKRQGAELTELANKVFVNRVYDAATQDELDSVIEQRPQTIDRIIGKFNAKK